MVYTFKHGDRPIAGYTVQRGVGRGAFGEVYYALSDGGKEVALKYLRDNPVTELRGVNQCLNLKSPYLVTLYDVKQDTGGEFYVVMEYVSGPSLRDLLLENPEGVGVDKAVYLADGIAKGLRHLHERGIVHRDLKPGNIFYEDGFVKIGDYGLSKLMSTSQHSAGTMSVGTVHYMAPEIGSGNYHAGTDIYALGVMLYEMVLGRVPFEGASMGEILMKHLTAQPEVDALPEPFPAVIRKALAKDPRERYQNVDQLTSALFGQNAMRDTLSRFDVSTLSVRAERVGARVHARVGAGGTGSSQMPSLPEAPVRDDALTYADGDGRIASTVRRIEHTTSDVVRQLSSVDRARAKDRPAFPPRDPDTAGLLAIFLGSFGVHRFYLGYYVIGVIQALLSFTGISAIWGIIEGIIIFSGGMTDVHGRRLVKEPEQPVDWRSTVMRFIWGTFCAIFLLGTLPLIIVPTVLTDEMYSRSQMERDLRGTVFELQESAVPLTFMWAIAGLTAMLAAFFGWKAGHGPGLSFWRATIRPLVMAMCGVLITAVMILTTAYVPEDQQFPLLIVVVFFVMIGAVIWQIRGAEPKIHPGQFRVKHDQTARLAWLFTLAWPALAMALVWMHSDNPGWRNTQMMQNPFLGLALTMTVGALVVCCFMESVYEWQRLRRIGKMAKEAVLANEKEISSSDV